jgi:hypothetical protein
MSLIVVLSLLAADAKLPPTYFASEGPTPCGEVVRFLGADGEWLSVPEYSLVWRPSATVVGENFVPFASGGRWVVRDGKAAFQSQWDWGDLVFSSGRWTLHAKAGWVWVPEECGSPSDLRSANNEPMALPPLLPAFRVRTIKHPLGAQFAFPFGYEWGRVFPKGTEVPTPVWMKTMSAVPGEPGKAVLFTPPVGQSRR